MDGYWKSSAVLAVLLRDGKGVARDDKAAYYHFRVAALQGGEKAAELLANDLRTLSSELGPYKFRNLIKRPTAGYEAHSFAGLCGPS